MKIIIAGGTGLIGQALAHNLAQDGNELIILSRNSSVDAKGNGNIRFVKWDARTAAGWGNLADGADAIVNLAGENLSSGRWSERRKRAIMESRVNAGNAIVQAVQQSKNKASVLIQASGVGSYGTSETALFNENDPYGDDFLAGICKAWEAGTRAVEELGVRRVVTRLGVVLSTKGGAFPRMLLPFQLFAGGPLGRGRQWMSWVHLEDAVRALRFLIETPEAEGTFNISAEPLTNRQFARTLGKVMRRPSFFTVPAFVLRLMFGEMSIVILDGQRVSARRLEDLGFRFRYRQAEHALNDLLI